MSWKAAFDRTWLGDPGLVAAIDEYIRARLVQHRRLPPRTLGPGVTSLHVLASDVLRFGQERRWFWVIVAMGLLLELVVCAEQGTPQVRSAIQLQERGGGLNGLGHLATPIILLRNAMVHPASAAPKEAFADEFVSWLERNGEVELARQQRGRWAVLGSEDVARLALRRLDGVGAALRRFA